MIQKLLIVSCAFTASVLSKGITVCDLPTEWFGNNMTSFPEPINDDFSSYILIDTPSQLSSDNTTCECSPILGSFSYWMTNGTWSPTDLGGDCTLKCDRCQVYYCIHGFQDTLLNSTNVTVNADSEPTCILPTDDEVVETTTTGILPTDDEVVETTTTGTTQTDDVSIHVEVQIKDGDKMSNYTLVFPEQTETTDVADVIEDA